MEAKTILVTGGAGFIGTHLCSKLLDLGHNVICLDNLVSGSLSNISSFSKNLRFEFVKHDITKPYHREDIDEIYNLACPASPIQYKINPIKTIKTCTIGVINILGLAKKNNAKVLQASTSEVYGDPEIHPQNEKYNGNVNITGDRSCYDEGKRCAETLFNEYSKEHNLNIKIARIFNTYGPYMAIDDGRVISNFINQSIFDKDLTVYGDGNQTRSFQYISDLVDGLIKLMDSDKKCKFPVNIGNSHEITINELASIIIKITNSKSKLVYKDLPDDDPMRRKPDISLALRNLNWKPKININNGLAKTIEYFKNIT